MNTNIVGLALSVLLLIVVLVIARLLIIFFPSVSPETVRKFVHIGASNWWFILVAFFDNLYAKLLGPVCFIILNSLATFLGWAKFFGASDMKRNYGLIHFPISLVIIILLIEYKIIPELAGAVGILIMGWGDGFAGLIGRSFGRNNPRIIGKKTLAGSAAMFIVSNLVMVGMFTLYKIPLSYQTLATIMLVAAVSTIIELVTPLGLDNLTVPILTSLLVGKLIKHLL